MKSNPTKEHPRGSSLTAPADKMVLPGGTTIDEFEAILANDYSKAECPLEHFFIPGLYIRRITIPAGTMGSTMKHKFDHPFILSQGVVELISETEGSVTYRAPHVGITRAGTKRVMNIPVIPENAKGVIWTTFHLTDETDVDKIVEAIVEPGQNPLLTEEQQNQWRESGSKNITTLKS